MFSHFFAHIYDTRRTDFAQRHCFAHIEHASVVTPPIAEPVDIGWLVRHGRR